MSRFIFTSQIAKEYQEELESLLFFNTQQKQLAERIMHTIEEYGHPEIDLQDGKLRIRVGEIPDCQSLFILDQSTSPAKLAAVVVFSRDEELLVILHIAVLERFSSSGEDANHMLFMQAILELQKIAKTIKGVQALALIYGGDTLRRIPL